MFEEIIFKNKLESRILNQIKWGYPDKWLAKIENKK